MIVLGRLVAPYGVKGWLRLHAFGDDPASWADEKLEHPEPGRS